MKKRNLGKLGNVVKVKDLLDQEKQWSNDKFDLLVSVSNIKAVHDGKRLLLQIKGEQHPKSSFIFGNGFQTECEGEFPITELAVSQMVAKFNTLLKKATNVNGNSQYFRYQYFALCSLKSQVTQLNEIIRMFLDKVEDKDFTLRFNKINGEDTIRAVLSKEYGIMNNIDILKTIIDLRGNIDILNPLHSENFLHFNLISVEEIDGFLPGMHGGNSEVASGFFDIDYYILDSKTGNGYFAPMDDFEKLFHQIHRFVNWREVEPVFQKAIKAYDNEKAKEIIKNLLSTMQEPIDHDVEKVMEAVRNKFSVISKSITETAQHKVKLYAHNGVFTLYALIASLSEAARTKGEENRFEIEMAISKLMSLQKITTHDDEVITLRHGDTNNKKVKIPKSVVSVKRRTSGQASLFSSVS
ncbi:MAG: hypothetical protein ACOCQR_00095 [bacterium]